jgi:hypothetical protein
MRGGRLSSARFQCGSHEARHSHSIDSSRRFTGQFILVQMQMTMDGSRDSAHGVWSSKLWILDIK